jgi:ureidoacrylate peracid hydrolase
VAAARGICPAINRMAAGLRDLGGTVIWCTHANVRTAAGSDWPMFFDHFVASEVRTRTLAALSPGDPGQRIWRDLNVEPGDLHLVKNRYSALIPGSSALERVLRGGGIDTVAIAGTKTNVCCESTARDAMMLDFRVVLLADATAALSPGEHSSALENVIQQFGDVLTVDQALERMR